jgi:hypothetical protein
VKGLTIVLGLVDSVTTQLEASRVPVPTATPATEEPVHLSTVELWQLPRKGQRTAVKQRVGPRLPLLATVDTH